MKPLLSTVQNAIEHWVINTLLNTLRDNADELENFLKDLAVHGCASGAVSELIYTEDCVDFYTRFEADIWEIVTDYIESVEISLGEFMNILHIDDPSSLKVNLAWFSVEHSAYRLLNACETEG